MTLSHRAGLSVVALAALAGCTVGPDYKKPEVQPPLEWSGAQTGPPPPGVEVPPGAGCPDVAEWWRQFNDPTLTSLVERAAGGSLTLAQAESRLRQARAARDIAASALYPSVDAAASYARTRAGGGFGGQNPSTTTNLFRAGFDATWEIDVFGGVRRGVEAADASVDSAYFDRESVLVSLVAEVASAYLDLRGAQTQLTIATENLAAQKQTLEVTQERFGAGFVGVLDVANSKAQVSLTAAVVPTFEAQVRSDIYALSVLLGLPPGTLLEELSPEAPLPQVSGPVPVGLPSELLQRRPDLRKAEADLHAATANIGVAVADQYPKFSLTGSFGLQGDHASSLGTLADRYWSIGPAVSVPLFTGGRIQGNIEQAKAIADQSLLTYRAAVLTALQEVETALIDFTREQERRASLSDSVDANRQAVDAALELYGAGKTDFLNVTSAQGLLFATQTALAQSQTNVGQDLVALYKALGGGWPGDEQAAQPAPTQPD